MASIGPRSSMGSPTTFIMRPKVPGPTDGLSLVPTLLGRIEQQAKHAHLYWEFHERGFNQAVLMDGRWKAIRLLRTDAPVELYDVANDIGER